jgi:MFS family permease
LDSAASASPLTPSADHSIAVTNARRWAVVSLLFIASIINYFDRATISFALPLISRDFHLGPASEGLLLSSFFWSYTLMQLPIGAFADRLDLLWIYAATFALWSLAQGLTGLAASLAVLIALRMVLGIGESIYLPGGTKIVSLLYNRNERGAPSGFFDFGTRIGIAAGGLVMPLLLARFGWRWAFVAVGVPALVWLIPWFAVFPARAVRERARAARASLPRLGGRRHLRFNRNLLGICLGFFCFDYFWYLMVTWLPDYLYVERHLSIVKAGLYAALPYAVFGVSEPLGGWIADRLIHRGWDETRTRKGIVTVGFLFGLLIIPAARVRTAHEALALIVGAGFVGLSTANLLVILQSCAPPGEVGLWTGFENFAGNIGGILAPLVTGFLIKWSGSFLPAFILGPAILLSGLFSYWFVVGRLEPVKSSTPAG